MPLLFDIGFLTIRIWDILDILIFGYLIFRIYKLLRGSVAFNIFIGVLFLYAIWFLIDALDMDLLSTLFGSFAQIGVLVLVIIFQPEVRRFLLLIGNTTLRQRSNFLSRLFDSSFKGSKEKLTEINAIVDAMMKMSTEKTGVLIILAKGLDLEDIRTSGTKLNADINRQVLLTIFQKESPLHDGAVIIDKGKILNAGCILPVSDSTELPKSAGLRHRAAVGISERSSVLALIVSEESGVISCAFEGNLERRLSEEKLKKIIKKHY